MINIPNIKQINAGSRRRSRTHRFRCYCVVCTILCIELNSWFNAHIKYALHMAYSRVIENKTKQKTNPKTVLTTI